MVPRDRDSTDDVVITIRVAAPPGYDWGDACYEIRGLRVNNQFSIGLQYAGGDTPPVDIIPAVTYDQLVSGVTPQVSLERLADRSTERQWPHIGDCRIEPTTGSEVEARIRIYDEWVSGEGS